MEPRLVAKPAGAIPGGLFGQIVVALTTLLIAAFIIAYAIQGGSTEEEPETTAAEPVLSGEGIQRRVEHSIEEQRNASNRPAERPEARDRLRDANAKARSGPAAGPRPACHAHGRLDARADSRLFPAAQVDDGDDPLDGMIEA